MKFTNEVYNLLKSAAQIWLPAIATLYFALAGIWGLPAANQVIGSITAVDTFLGAILAISSAQFNKNNTIVMIKTPKAPVTADPKSLSRGKHVL